MAIPYDPALHFLLRDPCHEQAIYGDDEFAEFVERYRAEIDHGEVADWGMHFSVFEVQVPEWPPSQRWPLPIIMLNFAEGGGEQGTYGDFPWPAGVYLASEADWFAKRAARNIAADMVPDWGAEPHRMAYAWRCQLFDPARHVVIRYWCERNGVDIVDFWRDFYPTVEGELEVIETTNPAVEEEKAEGSFSPTRRCVRTDQLYLLRNHYLGTDETPPAPDPERQHRRGSRPQPRPVHDSQEGADQTVEWDIHQGTEAYTGHDVLLALERALGREARPWSDTTLDRKVAAISRESMTRYLISNPVSDRRYVKDRGGRNFDCDDFALTLRTDLIRDWGYNCVAVIAGDVHAWCAFVLAGEGGPEIAFIEPQTDALVTELTGEYSVERRCEVII